MVSAPTLKSPESYKVLDTATTGFDRHSAGGNRNCAGSLVRYVQMVKFDAFWHLATKSSPLEACPDSYE